MYVDEAANFPNRDFMLMIVKIGVPVPEVGEVYYLLPDDGPTRYTGNSNCIVHTGVLSKAATRFRFDWIWNGQPAALASRCTDETGYTQPALDDLVRVRGRFSYYHCNAVKTWFVHRDGNVSHV